MSIAALQGTLVLLATLPTTKLDPPSTALSGATVYPASMFAIMHAGRSMARTWLYAEQRSELKPSILHWCKAQNQISLNINNLNPRNL